MNMLTELWNGMLHSTPQGTLGVSAIWIYMAVIVIVALYRIKKGDHMHH